MTTSNLMSGDNESYQILQSEPANENGLSYFQKKGFLSILIISTFLQVF